MFNENRIPPEQLAAFKKDRTAAVVGRKLAQRFTWRLGDKSTLQGTIYPVDLEFTLRGIYTGLVPRPSVTQQGTASHPAA